jgi:hypothetical protein
MFFGSFRDLRLLLIFLFACVPLALAGCGGLRRIPVSGTVTLDGKPLQDGLLIFHPNEDKGNKERIGCSGRVHNGQYKLATSAVTRQDTGAGAPLGWFKVTLTNDLPGMPIIPVHQRFLRPETTPVEIEIVDNPAPGAYDIKLTTK